MIVTHTNLDWDAITGVWLLKRFGGLESADVEFVNTGNPPADLLAGAEAVVDTGQVYDPPRRRFDHHQFPGDQANATCAARQVYEFLRYAIEPDISHLESLTDLVFAGDTGRREADFSRELGLHALLSAYKAMYKEVHDVFAPDQSVLALGFGLLDMMEFRLRKQVEARAELGEKTVYKSKDGKVWGIKHGSMASSLAAQEQGAVLVVFQGEPVTDEAGEVTSNSIGVMRSGEYTSPHVGKLVEAIVEAAGRDDADPDNQALALELSSWFKHQAGFFAGRGTGKAPDARPIAVSLAYVARLIDRTWQR